MEREYSSYSSSKRSIKWLTPVIPAALEAEIWSFVVQRQPGQIVRETLSKKSITKKGLVECLKV
jgi:hypothetical protein